ncbi:primosomal replication protein N [Ottowia testudinis]|uniref:Replication restart protein PriB n=1 Tax=Ottowia testudinis TaxID=2816950 RepID=A0A975CET7_9BURK|nr:primosomal replication protein N [Ottowia testudinis]QTD44466.1 primosomal replication protein N [Ottowia testudinis]
MNQTRLTARIVEIGALRLTPAGVPALDTRLEHESEVEEGGGRRQVKALLKAVALGAAAERLGRQSVGTQWLFTGFLASPRNAKYVVLHIQDFQQD